MSTTLYDLSVGSYLQSLAGVANVLQKGHDYATAEGLDLDEITQTRLADDMLPFRFQVLSVVHHTKDSVESIMSGDASPQSSIEPLNYGELQQLIADTTDELKAVDADALNARAGAPVTFRMQKIELPFTAENWVLSFSLPNLYFHAATAYDILRIKGVPLSKRDFLGTMRITR